MTSKRERSYRIDWFIIALLVTMAVGLILLAVTSPVPHVG